MHAFADELLLEVLGRIDDGLTLLDVVPLVCKRWHRLSRDPAAWTSVTETIAHCPRGFGDHDEILNAARVILHAPALRRVRINCYSFPGPFSCAQETMTSALVRSRAKVREIVFPHPDALGVQHMFGGVMNPLPTALADFLSKNSSCVRYLKLGPIHCYSGEPSQHVLAELSKCVELRSLRCGVEGVALARTMPRLRSLTLMIHFPHADGMHQVLSAAERDLRRCGELWNLREMRLECHYNYEFDGKWGAEYRQALSELLTTLGSKATNVKHLSTSGMLSRQVSPETLIAFFKSLPRLESVHIDRFRFENLAQLAEVEGMKRISGEVKYLKGEADICHAAMEQFKRQRPDVDCRLTDRKFSF